MNITLKHIRHSNLLAIIKFICVLIAIAWLMSLGVDRLGYNWQWYRVPQYLYKIEEGSIILGPILRGLLVTINIVWISLIITTIIGLVISLLRLSSSFMGRLIARVYLEIIRNTPMLVQILFMYFVIGPIFDLERFTCGVLALSIFEGAYASEIFRAGIVSIHKGQWEAAHSLGLNTFHTYRYIILPQAVRRVLPPLTSQAIALIKDSALVSTIAVYEMTMEAMAIFAETFLVFEILFTIAAIYLIVTICLSFVVNIMEKRLKFIA